MLAAGFYNVCCKLKTSHFFQTSKIATPAPKPVPPPALSTIQQLEEAAHKVQEEAAMLEQERKAVEARTAAAEKAAKEQSALAAAEARLAEAETKLAEMQLRLESGLQQACREVAEDGDKSSSDSSDDEVVEEGGVPYSGDKASLFLACGKLAYVIKKIIYRYPPRRGPL